MIVPSLLYCFIWLHTNQYNSLSAIAFSIPFELDSRGREFKLDQTLFNIKGTFERKCPEYKLDFSEVISQHLSNCSQLSCKWTQSIKITINTTFSISWQSDLTRPTPTPPPHPPTHPVIPCSVFVLLMTSQWHNCDTITWIMISNSLETDIIHGDIHGRSCKKIRCQWCRHL